MAMHWSFGNSGSLDHLLLFVAVNYALDPVDDQLLEESAKAMFTSHSKEVHLIVDRDSTMQHAAHNRCVLAPRCTLLPSMRLAHT